MSTVSAEEHRQRGSQGLQLGSDDLHRGGQDLQPKAEVSLDDLTLSRVAVPPAAPRSPAVPNSSAAPNPAAPAAPVLSSDSLGGLRVTHTAPLTIHPAPRAVRTAPPAAGTPPSTNLQSTVQPPTIQRSLVHDPPRPSDDPWRLLSRYRYRAIVTDTLAGAVGGVLASGLRFGPDLKTQYLALSALVAVGWVLAVCLQRGYENRFLGTGFEEYRRLLDSGLVLFVGIAVVSFSAHHSVARGYVVLAVPVTVLLSLMLRRYLRAWLGEARSRGVGLRRVLVVGRLDSAAHLIGRLHHEPQHGLATVGACVDDVSLVDQELLPELDGVPLVGRPADLLKHADALNVHLVAVVSTPDLSGTALRKLSWELQDRGIELVVSPGIDEVSRPRLSIWPVAGVSLLHLDRPAASVVSRYGKQLFDRLVGAVLLAILAPLLIAVGIVVKASSPGPMIFRQTRIGVGGREFTMLKFRSMVSNAEALRLDLLALNEGDGLLFKIKKDPRITRIGKVLRRFSLDELPQLINVVRGDMSLVGPRPPLPHEVAAYSVDATRRLRVRPGLTGLWQISGRSDLSQEEALRLDLRYVDNWSLTADLSILWRTARAVLRGAGAY